MRVIKNWGGDAPWGVLPYIHPEFERLSDEDSDIIFFNGIEFIDNPALCEPYKNYDRRCLFAHWSPCEYLTIKDNFYFDQYDFFTDVYCVCPFTVKFMNQYYGYEKFKYIPYPYTNTTVDSFYNYDSHVCWFGSIHGQDHINAIETMSKFNYKFITSQQNTWMYHPYEYNKCTHINISTEDKLWEVSRCITSLTFNKLYMNSSSKYNAKYSSIVHEAFKYWDLGIMPQFKVRTHEIATCKSLILAYKDQWNLIEDFYEPEQEFIYFETFTELEDIIYDVINNFEKYIPIIENAYNRVQKYSVENIFQYMKTNDESLITWRSQYV